MTKRRRPRITKNYRRLAMIALFLVLATCGGLDTFDVTETSSATVPQGSILEQLIGDLGFGDLLSFDISQTDEFQNQGVKKSQIDSVYLRSLTLTITDPPSGQDFTFLDSLEFYLETEELPRILVASGGPFPADTTTVELTVEDVDLAPYAAAPSMDFTTDVTGRRPSEDVTIRADMVLDVDVNVPGVLCGS